MSTKELTGQDLIDHWEKKLMADARSHGVLAPDAETAEEVAIHLTEFGDEAMHRVTTALNSTGDRNIPYSFPSSVDQLFIHMELCIQLLLEEARADVQLKPCFGMRTSCQTGAWTVVVYAPKSEEKIYHINTNDIPDFDIDLFYEELEARFPNVRVIQIANNNYSQLHS